MNVHEKNGWRIITALIALGLAVWILGGVTVGGVILVVFVMRALGVLK